MTASLESIFPIQPELKVKLRYEKEGKEVVEDKAFKLNVLTIDDYTTLCQELGGEKNFGLAFSGDVKHMHSLMTIMFQLLSNEDKLFFIRLKMLIVDVKLKKEVEVTDPVKKLSRIIDVGSLLQASADLEKAYVNAMPLPGQVKNNGESSGENLTGQS